MAIIYSYSNENELRRSDKLVGTATTLHNGKVRRLTKNFTIGELSDFINGGEITSLTLTTDGTSGAATLIDNVLNIPIYGGGGAVWGDITGSVTNQTDLTEYLALNYYPLSSNPAEYLTISTLPIPTLQQVTDVTDGNLTSNDITVFNSAGVQQITLASDGVLNFKNIWESRVKLSSDLVVSDLVNFFLPNLPTGSYTLATMGDITVDTFQSVTDNGSTTTNALTVQNNIDIAGNYTLTVSQGNESTGVAKGSVVTANGLTGSFAGLISDGALILGNISNAQTAISANYLMPANSPVGFELPNKPTGTYTIATTADITATSGIPHATASGTDTYTATITGVTSYADGDAYLIRFTNGNTTGATLNINSLGAINLYRNNDGALIGGDVWAGAEMLCVYNSTANTFQCIGTSSNSLFAYVTNADSVAITKGQPVYAFGGQGDRLTVKRALNTSDSTSAQTVGVVLTSSIAVNQRGIIIIQGLLEGLNILPTSTWADGDPVYLGTTAGSITNIKQYAPNHLVYLGTVTTASNGSAGRWYVRVQNGYELDELHNVQAQSPTLKDTLWYDNSVSPAQWKTASISTILGYVPQPSLSFTPFKWLAVNSTPHTGTLSRTVIATATIPGGTYNSGDVMKTFMQTSKLLSVGNVTYRYEINTANTLSGAVQIGVFTTTTSLSYAPVQRTFTLRDNLLYGYTFGSSAITDVANVGGSQSSTPYDTANTLYLFFTVQTTNIADSATISLMTVTN